MTTPAPSDQPDDPRARWDERFQAAGAAFLFGQAPNAFLAREAHRIASSATVLLPADGEGRNGVFLAERGCRVTAVDVSPIAQDKARAFAAARGVADRITFHLADLATWDMGTERFDAVVAIFIQFATPTLRARLFAGFQAALKPGGLLLLEGYGIDQLTYGTGGPKQPEHLYAPDDLRAAFADLDILTLDAYEADLAEGTAHVGRSALVDLIARKPAT